MVPEVVIDIVEQLKNKYSIKLILKVLEVPKSNYYRWKNRKKEDDKITPMVVELCEANNYTYGYRKITALINRLTQSPVNHKRFKE